MTGPATRPSPIPLARIAVNSLSALNRPNTNSTDANIAIGNEKLITLGISNARNQATISNPTFPLTSMSLSCRSTRPNNNTNVNTPTVKNNVVANWRVIYFGKIFIKTVRRTNNFPVPKPRKIHLGPFQPALETALADTLSAHKQTHGPLAPVTVIVPAQLLGLHLRRRLAPHINVHFQTLDDLLRPAHVPPRLALELLCRQLAQKSDAYYAPIQDTPGFAGALLNTFTDLQEAGLTKLSGKLADTYNSYRQWLAGHNFANPAPQTANREQYLYGFYDLNFTQKKFIESHAPSAVFFPATENDDYSQPLLDWFKSLDYKVVASSFIPHNSSLVVSAPGETAEVREAVRAIFDYLKQNPGKTFSDCAILCRSRDQYDAILRDTLPQLGVLAFFRGGRPLTEQHDAKLLLLLLTAIRSDYSRSTVIELACHIGPRSNWDARTVQLGIVGGKSQWRARLRDDKELSQFVDDLFTSTDRLPKQTTWRELTTNTLAAFRQLGGAHPKVIAAIEALAAFDELGLPVDLPAFVEVAQKALAAATDQPERFRGGNVFISDVMGARGLSFDFVVVLGLVEKCFPRIIREDPLLPDVERRQLSPALPLKQRGHDEEKLLFDLTRQVAREQLILSYPRLDAGTSRPRVPSVFLLEMKDHRVVPLAPFRDGVEALDEREFDLAALHSGNAAYLSEISPLITAGVATEQTRWREKHLTRYDGRVSARELPGLETSATALETFFKCPFLYFQKNVLRIEKWEEPEATIVIDPLDLGTLYHDILEDFYQRGTLSVVEEHLQRYEQTGVTGYPAVWEIKKEIIRHEIAAFVTREQRRLGDWQPSKFETEFKDLVVSASVKLRGKIDRIDLNGQHARLIDYKTGSVPRGMKDDRLAGGEALQLPLYLLAAERILPGVTVEEASYLYFTMRGGYRDVRFSRGALEERRAELAKVLETAAAMIRAGIFVQYASENNCRHCDFRPICGNGVIKLAERKASDPSLAAFHDIKETVA